MSPFQATWPIPPPTEPTLSGAAGGAARRAAGPRRPWWRTTPRCRAGFASRDPDRAAGARSAGSNSTTCGSRAASTTAPSASARSAFSGTPPRRHDIAPQRIEQARHALEEPQVTHQAHRRALDQLVVRVGGERDGLRQRRQRHAVQRIESERRAGHRERSVLAQRPARERRAGPATNVQSSGGTTSAATSRSRECTLITWLSSSSSCRWVPAPICEARNRSRIFAERRRPRQHVELERKNVRAVHP